ncbi:MAG: hypothetical protein JW952_08260 [Candidatus Eisenbacteria bacterium]|nr:hypothetical protein [Candidatus Eisenbacteria bacterium]
MSRKIILFSVLLLMTPALALASSARLEGLGAPPDFIEDYANVFSYPVSICRYPAAVIGELGYEDGWGRGFGATMGLGQDNAYGVFGIMLREHGMISPLPQLMSGNEGSQFDLLWGMNFEKVSFGVRFDNTSSKLEWEYDDGTGMSFSPWYFYYGVSTDMVSPEYFNNMGIGISASMEVREADKVEATFEYRTFDFAVEELGDGFSIEDAGNPSFGFWGRGFFLMNENVTLVPMFGYNKYDVGWEIMSDVADDEDASDQTLTNMRAGLGMRVDMGSFFMLGVGFSQWKMDVENTFGEAAPDPGLLETFEYTGTSLPFLFGTFEADLRDWLTIRFGARKNLLHEKATLAWVDGSELTFESKNANLTPDMRDYMYGEGVYLPYLEEPFAFSMGVGFKWSDFEIDATLNEDYPFTGMYWLSGESEIPFGKISVTYYY